MFGVGFEWLGFAFNCPARFEFQTRKGRADGFWRGGDGPGFF
jgi:hypothetical protein